MTQWTDERIPIWVPPLPGEALDSWIACYTARLRASTRDFLTALGLPGSRPAQMAAELTPREVDALSLATGLDRAELVAMTLQPFDGLAVTISRGQQRRLGQPPWWRRTGARSRYCPRCLDDTTGRWPLEWRLPWIYACRHHHLLLLEACPACGNPPLAHSPSYRGPATPGLCAHPIPAAEPGKRTWSRCRHRLADTTKAVELSPDGPILAAQQRLRDLLHTRAVRPRAGRPRAPRNLRSGLAGPEGPGHGRRPGPHRCARRRTRLRQRTTRLQGPQTTRNCRSDRRGGSDRRDRARARPPGFTEGVRLDPGSRPRAVHTRRPTARPPYRPLAARRRAADRTRHHVPEHHNDLPAAAALWQCHAPAALAGAHKGPGPSPRGHDPGSAVAIVEHAPAGHGLGRRDPAPLLPRRMQHLPPHPRHATWLRRSRTAPGPPGSSPRPQNHRPALPARRPHRAGICPGPTGPRPRRARP